MILLTSGCSFTAGPDTWPNFLVRKLGQELDNLAVPSVSNSYVANSLIMYLEQNKNYSDPIIFNITGFDRFDLLVSSDTREKNPYCSWEHVFGVGVVSSEYAKSQSSAKAIKEAMLLDGMAMSNTLEIIKLITYLEFNKHDWRFVMMYDYIENPPTELFARFISKYVDKNIKFKDTCGMYEWGLRNNLLHTDKFHLSKKGNEVIADIIYEAIK